MRVCLFVLLSCVTSIYSESSDPSDDNLEKESAALQYTSETFSEAIAASNHFVMFYAPWCGHCHRLLPVWEELAVANNVEGSDVRIAKVDCTVESSLCSAHDVTGYPTLKFFKIGEEEGVKYRGPRELDSLSRYVEEQLGKPQEETETIPEVPKAVNGLFELTDSSFTNHIASGKHFVKFYAPWCGHCQKLAPIWDALAKSLEHSTTVGIAKIDCTQHRSACNEFEIKGYPTLLWIEDGKKVEKYQGARTHEDMKAFITRMAGASDTDASNDSVEKEAGPVVIFSGDNFEHGISTGVSFIKFFAPWCGHCKRLAATWEELGEKFVANSRVRIVKVDCTLDTSKDLCNQQEVDGFPTLLLYRDGEKVAEYNGSRSLDDLYEFVVKHLPHDEL